MTMSSRRQRPPRSFPLTAALHGHSKTFAPRSGSPGTTNQRLILRKRRRLLVAATLILSLCWAFLLRQGAILLPTDEYPSLIDSSWTVHGKNGSRPVLTAFLEPLDTLSVDTHPLPSRRTSASRLTKIEYPQVSSCDNIPEKWPVNTFPSEDPFLPWIHDVITTEEKIVIVAQNKRRCHVGEGNEDRMKHWEPQISLLQPVLVSKDEHGNYRLSIDGKETRFLCRFHTANEEYTTLSEFPFNYEYVTWRKREQSMFSRTDKKDSGQFWLSQLIFSCPIPSNLRQDKKEMWLDLVPIRTPPRYKEFLFTKDHVGQDSLSKVSIFNATNEWGTKHVLPKIEDSGRWANIPLCPSPTPKEKQRLAACTWTAASYTRRGDAVTMSDTAKRLREWILFHKMVGFEQLYIYDNTDGDESPLREICDEFDFVQYVKWPATVCNNNRPNHKNPGERSSQYAAEASCRERYGPNTDWLAFIDTDEYLVPMKSDTWNKVLDDMDARNIKILKMRSSRTKPRLELMETQKDQSTCVDQATKKSHFAPEPCVVPRKNETFLHAYNCEFIKPPRPDRFQRAMKQIYRPSHVLSHYVHYSTVTTDIAKLHKDFGANETYIASVHSKAWKDSSPEVFLDELTEGTLVHTKSVLPHETMYRSSVCKLESPQSCALGFVCPDHVEFSDALHTKNVFRDDQGDYCNCWLNRKVEDVFVPKLQVALEKHLESIGRQGAMA